MVQDVKAAGAPAVKDGAAIQSDLENGLTEAQNSFQRAVAKAKKLPTNDPAALTTGLTSLGTQIQSELTSTRSALLQPGEQVRRRRPEQGDGRRAGLQAVRLVVVVRLGVLDPEREPRQPGLDRSVELRLVRFGSVLLHRRGEAVT